MKVVTKSYTATEDSDIGISHILLLLHSYCVLKLSCLMLSTSGARTVKLLGSLVIIASTVYSFRLFGVKIKPMQRVMSDCLPPY